MVVIRPALSSDFSRVAEAHAQSWQTAYRGILSDQYLDGPVIADRQQVWQERMLHPSDTQRLWVAEVEGNLVGFACIFLDHDPQWGTLLDNLHVLPAYKGLSIGKKLITHAAQYSVSHAVHEGFYLWVFEENTGARAFYDQLGALNQERIVEPAFDGTPAPILRYVWQAAELAQNT